MNTTRTIIEETFHSPSWSHWQLLTTHAGHALVTADGLRLLLSRAQRTGYANAQIDDYARLPRRRFPWKPPLRLTVRARASNILAGTAGFGFWNDPFAPGRRRVALPAAIWFFYASPPSDMPLAQNVPGRGWKAACIDATQPTALAWAPLALPVLLLNRWQPLYRRIWPHVQRALRISEAMLPPLDTQWHEYTLEWWPDGARFFVDGQIMLESDRAPRGPLGFVAWVDNQWAVVTPRGRFGWGLLEVPGLQALDLAYVRIERLE